MPKIPDFSKFDLQGLVNSVKSILTNEPGTPNVVEGDPIGGKIVEISALLQNVANSQTQSAKDLTNINNLLNELYKDLEAFRKLEAEFHQKREAETMQQKPHAEVHPSSEAIVTPPPPPPASPASEEPKIELSDKKLEDDTSRKL